MKKFMLLLAILQFISGNAQSDRVNISGLTIDPNIRAEVERHLILSKEFDQANHIFPIHENAVLGEFFVKDSLIFSNADISRKQLFKCFYFWKDGVLGINGAFGLFGGIGFYIKIDNRRATLFHMLSADDFPTLAYGVDTPPLLRLEVPCTETKIILSEVPERGTNQVVYGYVEFQSADYFSVTDAFSDDEIAPRERCRSNMKIYFKSSFLDL